MVRLSSLLLAGLSFVPARVLGALEVNLDDTGIVHPALVTRSHAVERGSTC